MFYRTLAPSPDGRFLAVTRSWDTGLDPLAVLLGGQQEEVHLLDAHGPRARPARGLAPPRQPLPRLGEVTARAALWV